jgi:GT2 family glycosyltransferase
MSSLVDVRACVIVPNWNGGESLKDCLNSLQAQSFKPHIIVVDNGSADGSVDFIKQHYPSIELIEHKANKGYAGGVNPGFKRAIELGVAYAAPFNNDAVADQHWLEKLVAHLDKHSALGIAACKLLSADGKKIDSTGDYYTNWGLPYPRGRGESDIYAYDSQTELFAASGGASLYRIKMLKEIGLFDEDFFAYYEDVDLSFRAQLAGWKVGYVPAAVAYHQIGATSGKLKGFTTYQTLKNLPLLWFKNTPLRYLWPVGWRLFLANTLFFGRALSRGQVWPALKGLVMASYRLLAGFSKRSRVQRSKTVSDEYIWNMLVHDLPPNASALRKLRSGWWKLIGNRRV